VIQILPYISAKDVAKALPIVARHLRNGGLIAYPTETVYGFGGLIRDDALNALAKLKSREASKPFLILVRTAEQLPALQWTSSGRKLADAFWPGPLTLALQVQNNLPKRILSAEGTVAVRATPHEALRALLDAVGEPITSTSANAPGQATAVSAPQVAAVLAAIRGDDVLILDGGVLPESKPSTLVDCSREPARIIREGPVSREALAQIVELA